jgi:hypothetical protein
LVVAMGALICLATAQNSQVRSSPAKSAPDPLQNAIKPLTPKSAMPVQRKPSVAVPNASPDGGKTNAELSHLERQNIKAGSYAGSSKSGAGIAKSAPAPRPADRSSGSGINFKYQRPVGTTASKPGAQAGNSSTPRVTKKN